jgi:hypothetical protein
MNPKTVRRANNPAQEEMCFPEAAFEVFGVVGDGDVLEVWVGEWRLPFVEPVLVVVVPVVVGVTVSPKKS